MNKTMTGIQNQYHNKQYIIISEFAITRALYLVKAWILKQYPNKYFITISVSKLTKKYCTNVIFRLTEDEKEKLLQKKKSEEESLRKSGELQGMAGLLTKLPEVCRINSRSQSLFLAQYSLTVQNCGLKHPLIHYSWPSTALQCRIVA